MPAEPQTTIPLGDFLNSKVPSEPQRHMHPLFAGSYSLLRANVREWETGGGAVDTGHSLPVSWRYPGEENYPRQNHFFPIPGKGGSCDFGFVASRVFRQWATVWRGDFPDKQMIEVEWSPFNRSEALMLSSFGRSGIVGVGASLGEPGDSGDGWRVGLPSPALYYMHPGLESLIGEGEIDVATRFFYAMTLETIHGRDRAEALFKQLERLAGPHTMS